ncbi:CopG family transcriptional regulator [Nostoc sp. 'Peltigera membranacea cyanobiont' 213]|uniref:CopG family transcriptional regulator n=1 Tax=unclassified Nostoc TaxID=2593658 RepID=UPI000B958603|nr:MULTISPECIES: CopG family transcriptional regulator [unclassified Nostoc]AVH62237.1 CopG family transcriptional regulator [Nostoc sp. 'Peltigera membranacea cyanobiont' N6]OYD98311.1 CopG family transcriptional regulator [Nostoc sp. 'Peltigera membranacea cyanobiont' 213]
MNKKWAVKRLTVNLTTEEMKKLENYCALTGRPATDVIRELLRSLEVENSEKSEIGTADSRITVGSGSISQ